MGCFRKCVYVHPFLWINLYLTLDSKRWTSTFALLSCLLKRGWRRTNMHQIHFLKCFNKYLKMYRCIVRNILRNILRHIWRYPRICFFKMFQVCWNKQREIIESRRRPPPVELEQRRHGWLHEGKDVVSEVSIWQTGLDRICHPPMFFLGGGFKYFLFSSLSGEDLTIIFEMGWNQQLVFSVIIRHP